MLLLEGNTAFCRLLSLADDLNVLADVARIGSCAEIVEDELGARGTNVVDAAGKPDDVGLVRLARLEVAELLKELGVVVGGLELVRVRVEGRIGSAGVEQSLDLARADLVVLVRVQVLFLGGGGLGLGGGLGGSGGGLGGLFCLLLACLLALLELRLGDLCAACQSSVVSCHLNS